MPPSVGDRAILPVVLRRCISCGEQSIALFMPRLLDTYPRISRVRHPILPHAYVSPDHPESLATTPAIQMLNGASSSLYAHTPGVTFGPLGHLGPPAPPTVDGECTLPMTKPSHRQK